MRLQTRYMKIFGIDDVLIGAAIGGLGSIFTNKTNSENVDKTNAANAQQAELNREFQERMSNTAYQRGMADMKAAGLNPILAYQKGGASSPGGAQAAMTAPHVENVAEKAVSTALQLKRNTAEVANLQQTEKNLQATEKNIATDTALKEAQAARTMSEDRILGYKLSPAQLEAKKAQLDHEIYENSAGGVLRKTGTIAEETNRSIEPLLNSAKAAVPYLPTQTTRSGSRWNSKGEVNHYQDSNFTSRWTGH